jgi:prepilin-type N-terminal cleavage/methylation domain-containing protein
MKKNRYSKGFTLVELSIVLIVIAIVIGGILGGQEILYTARKANVVTEVNQIKAALNNFSAKYYGNLPGDYPDAERLWGSSLASDGDGDGYMEKGADDETGETLQTFVQLSLAEMYPGKFSGSLDSGAYSPGVNIPGSEFSNKAGYLLWAYGRNSDSPSAFGRIGNVLEMGGCSNMSGSDIYCYNPIMNASVAQEIDAKIDDGKADGGMVYGVNGIDGSGSNVAGCSANITSSSGDYDVDNDAEACRMLFWLGNNEI